jgi:hypothetical protein
MPEMQVGKKNSSVAAVSEPKRGSVSVADRCSSRLSPTSSIGSVVTAADNRISARRFRLGACSDARPPRRYPSDRASMNTVIIAPQT